MDGRDRAVIYADYRNTFKPAAIDFGPDVTPAVLNPEVARSYEVGFKGRLIDGRLDYDVESFFLHFNNLVVATTDADGNPVQENAGSELFKGIEAEARYRLRDDLKIAWSYSYHDARYGSYLSSDGGANVDYGGNHVEMSPHALASSGVIVDPAQGLQAHCAAAYVGRRWLDRANTASTPSYVTLDAGLGYRWRRFSFALEAYNLTDERKPATESEFGDSSYYLLPARSVMASVGVRI
jgi:iron complex outermembrane receptor protein